MQKKIRDMFVEHRGLVLFSIAILVIAGYLGWRWATEPDRRLYGLDTNTGRVLWTASLPAVRRPLSPVAANQRVFVAYVSAVQGQSSSRYNVTEFRVSAFDGGSGKLLWEYKPDLDYFGKVDETDWLLNSLVATGDGVYLAFNSARRNLSGAAYPTLIALDAATGKQRWTLDDIAAYDGGPAPVQSAGARLFVIVGQGAKGAQLLMIDPQTGQTVQKIQSWENFAFYDFQRRPYFIANSQAVYLTGAVEKETRQVLAFDRMTGKPRFSLPQNGGGKIWCDDVNLYVLQGASRVNVYDAVTGQLRWTYDPYRAGIKFVHYLAGLSSSGNLGLVIADGEGDLYRSSESWIIALDAQNGHVQWSKPYASFLGGTIYPPVDTKGPILMIGGTGRRGGVLALSPANGSEQWHFVTQGIDNNDQYYSPMLLSPASDGAHTFVISYVPRLSGLLTQINPDWH